MPKFEPGTAQERCKGVDVKTRGGILDTINKEHNIRHF